ncbi:MAG: manganese efflux pump MntP family protein [Bacteroidota bacterium]|nr:manganese efflux pump MntP family protein [Bacteroidota bacterium]MDP4206772.1 manganese efflux pump MntP family protein [Bacteroidota bacterium]
MSFLTLLMISIGLSVDSFAVSLGCGFSKQGICFKRTFWLAFSLAAFQAAMPVVGWAVGTGVRGLIEQFDHWIAFILLSLIGAKMIIESIRGKETDEDCACHLTFKEVITLSVGTSIDALVVGFSFAFLKINIAFASLIIGLTTFLFAFAGVLIGKKAGHLLGKEVEIAGGVILVLLGVKILLEHLCGIHIF